MNLMKKYPILKFGVIAVMISFLLSSCSVTYRERHRHYQSREKVIVVP